MFNSSQGKYSIAFINSMGGVCVCVRVLTRACTQKEKDGEGVGMWLEQMVLLL